MSISRISSSSLFSQSLYNLEQNQSNLTQLSNEISSGKKIQTASDDPVATSQLLGLNLDSAQTAQYQSNITSALSEISTTSTALTSIVQVGQTASQLAVEAANGTNGVAQLGAISTQVQGLINQLVEQGNTSFEGRYVFSGFKTDTPAFSISGGNVTYNGTPSTSPNQRQVQVGPNSSVTINLTGDNVLGSVSVAGNTATGSGLLQALTQFQLDLQSSNSNGLENDITNINNNVQSVSTLQAQMGETTDQLQMVQSRLTQQTTTDTTNISSLQDVDMASAISNLSFAQTVYQASLSAMSQLMQTSSTLTNFL